MSSRQIPAGASAPAVSSKSASKYYGYFLEERDEILKHKWIESQKAGEDIGFDRALTEWVREHRDEWRKERERRKEKK
ncbi:DUF4032 domain-containing protein [Verrucomicrobium sp. BvORR106]|uniref:DUF4032 domain-containing protein n=1 Tax=Verrucomicrobium sp. BvORR106 TaxID=1403819 RepID=UPI00056F4510|nr:DUF4032 domain-containing protein [Verrucomicrobium sp. BvORR106]